MKLITVLEINRELVAVHVLCLLQFQPNLTLQTTQTSVMYKRKHANKLHTLCFFNTACGEPENEFGVK
jgi:hypothetical protein